MTRERIVFAVLAFVQMSLIAAISLVAVALPAIKRELALGEPELTLVTAGYGIAFSGLLILGGRLGDRIGPAVAFGAGMVLFGLASAVGASAGGLGALLAARFGQGVGAALAAPAALTLAGAIWSDPGQRTRALAAWGGLSATGAVAGMLLSGVIVAWLGWRWVFAPPVLAAALAILAAPLLPRIRTAGRPPLDVPGGLLVTGGLSALTCGLLSLGGAGGRGAAWAVTLLGGGLLALFPRVEARVPNPLLPPGFLKGGYRLRGLAAILSATAASAATSFFLSLFLQQVRGLSPLQTAAYFLPMFLVVGAAKAAGPWILRSGPLPVAAAGLASTAAGLCLLGLWMGLDAPAALVPGLLLFPLGLGLTFSGSVVVALDGVRPGEEGLAGGVVNTAMEVGPTVGLAALVVLSRLRAAALAQGGAPPGDAAAGGYALALWAASGVFLLMFAGFLAAIRRREGGAAAYAGR